MRFEWKETAFLALVLGATAFIILDVCSESLPLLKGLAVGVCIALVVALVDWVVGGDAYEK